MLMNQKLRTRLLVIAIAFLISIVISSLISWCLVQIFSKTPEEILNISLGKVITSLFTNVSHLQLFALLVVAFTFFIVLAVLKVFNLDNYMSKTYEVTSKIKIPLPVGDEQTQQGSAWWLPKKELKEKFGTFTFDPTSPEMSQLLAFSDKNMKEEKKKMDELAEELKLENEIKKVDSQIEYANSAYDTCFYKNKELIKEEKKTGMVSYPNFINNMDF